MKKKEDMRRLFKEERTGSKTGKWAASSFMLALFFFQNLSAQVPVNGFCKYTSFKIPIGFDGLIFQDNPSNILLYSQSKKEIASIVFKDEEAIVKKNKLNYEISSLLDLSAYKKNNDLLIFTSRKNRLVGILEQAPDYSIKLNSILEFDSYPENISAADINNDGILEFLISGSGFDGLSILQRKKIVLGEKKILTGNSYGKAVFAELNNDDYADIVAYNLLEGSLQFFYNTSESSFESIRSIKVDELQSNLLALDFDEDTYTDILYAGKSVIEIIYGDFASKFKRKVKLKTQLTPHLIRTGDFNDDDLTDIVYLNKDQGSLGIIFSKGNGNFFDEIIYLNNEQIINFSVNKNNNIDEIFCLNKNGFIYKISKLNYSDIKSEIKILPAAKSSFVFTLDDEAGNITTGYFSEEDNTINIFMGNNGNWFNTYYKIPAAEMYNEVKSESSDKNLKYLYFYSFGKELIEIYTINLKNNSVDRKQLYTPGGIADIEVERVNSNLINIYVAYNKLNKLHLGKFEQKKLSITFKEFPVVDTKSDKVDLVINDEPVLYYWKNTADTFYYVKAEIKTGPNNYFNYFSIANSTNLKINFTSNYSGNLKNSVISLVNNNPENFAVVSDNEHTFIASTLNKSARSIIKEMAISSLNVKNRNYHGILKSRDVLAQNVYWIDILLDQKMYELLPIAVPENSTSSSILETINGKAYLIYSDKKESRISLSKLNR